MKLTEKQKQLLADFAGKSFNFPGPGQSRSCDSLERDGLLESRLLCKSTRITAKGANKHFTLAYRTTDTGKAAIEC